MVFMALAWVCKPTLTFVYLSLPYLSIFFIIFLPVFPPESLNNQPPL